MKTPRQLLFERHRSAEPKLDAVREFVVAAMGEPRCPPAQPAAVAHRVSWREMILSFRWHLAGLGAAWLVVLFLNIDRLPSSVADLPREKIPPPRKLVVSFQAYRQELRRLLEPPGSEPAAVPPRRSECRPAMEMA